MLTPPRTVVHRAAGLYGLERALQRRGFALVAGADEAGRGACAGPLVVAAAVLPPGRRGEIDELADSKLLTPAARERVYAAVVEQATAYSVVVIPPGEIDARGLHVCNLAGMRRALASLAASPEYALTDGFRVDGLGVPALGVWKGDQVAACVAAASVVAKVTRDRIMTELHDVWPSYGFAEHKGYATPEHSAALREHGPCRIHRFSYINVAAVAGRVARHRPPAAPGDGAPRSSGRTRGEQGTVGVAHGGMDGGMEDVADDAGYAAASKRAAVALVGNNGGMEGGLR
jgi:ribonuclease HII